MAFCIESALKNPKNNRLDDNSFSQPAYCPSVLNWIYFRVKSEGPKSRELERTWYKIISIEI